MPHEKLDMITGVLKAINNSVRLITNSICTLFLFFMLSSNYAVGSEIEFYEKLDVQEIVFIIMGVIGMEIVLGGEVYFLFYILFLDKKD